VELENKGLGNEGAWVQWSGGSVRSAVPVSSAPGLAERRRWSLSRLMLPLLLASGSLCAQIHNFQHYGAEDGLPQVQVFSIEQDGDGYLWVGTYSGLGRYNGREFVNYSKTEGLGANLVSALTVDGQGRLWAGTGSGLCVHEPSRDRFECPSGEGLEEAYVNALLAEGDYGLWAGTDRGLYRIDERGPVQAGTGAGLGERVILSLAAEDGGGLWVGAADGLFYRATGQESFVPVSLPLNATSSSVTALYVEGGRLWIGTHSGLFRHQNGRVERVEGLPTGWEDADISDMARDRAGDLWVVSGNGVLHQRLGQWRALGRDNGLVNEITHAVRVDREGLVWLGHDDGLSKWIPSPFVGYQTVHGLIDSFVRTIAEDERGALWLGTRSGVQVVEYTEGDWNFSSGRTLTQADGLPDNRVYSIDFPSPNQALIATSGGVARWHADQGIVDVLTEADGLPTNKRQAVLVDHAGGLWIGTNLGTVFLG